MVVYLDMAFLLNCLTDAAALYVTAQVSGLQVRRWRLLLASVLGGTYGVLCVLPPLRWAAAFFPQMAAAVVLVWLAFGHQGAFLRQFLLFFLLSCTMGGILLAVGRLVHEGGSLEILKMLDWKVFFLASVVCFFLLTIVFRGGARHVVAGEICRAVIQRHGRETALTVLLDTGHTLTDAVTGEPVLTVYYMALNALWTPWECVALARLEQDGAVQCLQRLKSGAGGFRLLPYRAVGVSTGLLLCFRADRVCLDGRDLGRTLIALSPTPVSDGGGYVGLWGGGREERHAA